MSKKKQHPWRLLLIFVILVAGLIAALPARRWINERRTQSLIRSIYDAEQKHYAQTKCFGDLSALEAAQLITEPSEHKRGVARGFRFMVARDCNHFLIVAVPEQTQGMFRSADYWYQMDSRGELFAKAVKKPPFPIR